MYAEKPTSTEIRFDPVDQFERWYALGNIIFPLVRPIHTHTLHTYTQTHLQNKRKWFKFFYRFRTFLNSEHRNRAILNKHQKKNGNWIKLTCRKKGTSEFSRKISTEIYRKAQGKLVETYEEANQIDWWLHHVNASISKWWYSTMIKVKLNKCFFLFRKLNEMWTQIWSKQKIRLIVNSVCFLILKFWNCDRVHLCTFYVLYLWFLMCC